MAWKEYSGKYDPADFVVPPQLQKGESQRIQCYIQSHHHRLLDIVGRSGHFPFSNSSDVIRWCIHYGLQYLDTLEPATTRTVMSQANMMNHYLKEQMHQMKHLEWMENLRTHVASLVSRGDEDAARETVALMWREVQKMPDDSPHELRWKLKYLEALETNYSRYMPNDDERKAA